MYPRLVTTGLQEFFIGAIDAFECKFLRRGGGGRDISVGGKGLKDIAESTFGNLIPNVNLCSVVKREELLLLSSSLR